jgi:starch synthase
VIQGLTDPTYEQLLNFNVTYSDGFVLAGETLPAPIVAAIKSSKKPVLDYKTSQTEKAYVDFYTDKIAP